MHHFTYIDGILHAEDCNLIDIARQVSTPFYIYSKATLVHHVKVLKKALSKHDPLICYAMKANSNQAVLTLLKNQSCGVDIVSGGELQRALSAGFSPDKIVYSGVGKTDAEIADALDADILCFNIESAPELDAIANVAQSMGKTARVSFRINPDVDAKTINRKIATGTKENKFGVDYDDAPELYKRAAAMNGIQVTGIDMHIGSQITKFDAFDEAMARLVSLARQLISEGIGLEHIDFGGGIGIPYDHADEHPPTPDEYAILIDKHMADLPLKMMIEPGRVIAGNAGILVTEVIFKKAGHDKAFVIVDAAMNDLIRPTLYEAHHDIWPVDKRVEKPLTGPVDIVGPVCETGDYLGENRHITDVDRGELIAIMTAGAYGAVQSGTYNSRPLIPEIMVDENRFHIIRERMNVEDIIALDSVPDWV